MSAQPLRICLAASGGGHLRQLLDLESVWGRHDHFFVTTDFALGRSVAAHHRVHFVAEYGFGMWHQRKRWVMITRSSYNFFQSARVILRERPQLVITTGAAAIFWTIVLARLFGARLVSIESFARVESPSVYGKLARRFADHLIVQSAKLKVHWPEAEVFDPLRVLDKRRPAKEALAFITVGALTPFDRMVEGVLALKAAGGLPERLVVQTGRASSVKADVGTDIDIRESLDFNDIQALLKRTDLVICHGGTGSIITALREGCRVVAMPRRFELGEAFDSHQNEIIDAFAARGLLERVDNVADLGAAIARVRARHPQSATTDPAELRAYLTKLIAALPAKRVGQKSVRKYRDCGVQHQSHQREA